MSASSVGVQPFATIEGSERRQDASTRRGQGRTQSCGTPAGPAKAGSRREPRVLDLPSPPPLLTVREVARRLRVRPVTVYRLCERGELAHIRVSNAIRIRLEDLDQYVARRRGPDGG